jgi:hypothetical protein
MTTKEREDKERKLMAYLRNGYNIVLGVGGTGVAAYYSYATLMHKLTAVDTPLGPKFGSPDFAAPLFMLATVGTAWVTVVSVNEFIKFVRNGKESKEQANFNEFIKFVRDEYF